MNTITIFGLGPGELNKLSIEAYQLLTKEDVWLRTTVHPCIKELEEKGYSFNSFDNFYDKEESFEELYRKIVDFLLNKALDQNVYYGVPGNPLFNERTVELLIEAQEKGKVNLKILPGISYLDIIADSLKQDLGENTKLVDCYKVLEDNFSFDSYSNLLISEVWSEYYLGELKLKLMQFYPDNTEVILIYHAGMKDENLIKTPLFELDHNKVDYLTSLFVPVQPRLNRDFNSIVDITRYLRSPEGCPWDRKQTHESLKRYLIEETFEVVEALDKGDIDNLQEELGDLLFEILIHSQIAQENNEFSIYDVIENISEKMIRRHPHVFSNTEVNTVNQVLVNWEAIKKKEKGKDQYKYLADDMRAIPRGIPALLKSDKIQRKARSVGFDWDDPIQSMDKVIEETKEVLETLVNQENIERIREELGDLLFATVNITRLTGIDPEEALRLANDKFINRFELMEKEAERQGKVFKELSLDEQENLWNLVKLNKN